MTSRYAKNYYWENYIDSDDYKNMKKFPRPDLNPNTEQQKANEVLKKTKKVFKTTLTKKGSKVSRVKIEPTIELYCNAVSNDHIINKLIDIKNKYSSSGAKTKIRFQLRDDNEDDPELEFSNFNDLYDDFKYIKMYHSDKKLINIIVTIKHNFLSKCKLCKQKYNYLDGGKQAQLKEHEKRDIHHAAEVCKIEKELNKKVYIMDVLSIIIDYTK